MKKPEAVLQRVLLFSITVLFLCACSNPPLDWTTTSKITGFSFFGTDITVKLKGYPPFELELYDNPCFEGNPHPVTIANTDTLSPIITMDLADYGIPYFLRVRSKYGKWMVFSEDGISPGIVGIYNISDPYGGQTNPIMISDRDDLINISNSNGLWNGGYYFILSSDIDLSGVNWKPIGSDSIHFLGYFNGGGHIISGLEKLDTSDTGGYAGLFGYVEGATIQNLGIKIGDITCDDDIIAFGGLAGAFMAIGTISSCSVTGTKITGKPGTLSMGGLVGMAEGTIENCYTNITVEGKQVTGGLAGEIWPNSTINYCYAAGDVIYSGTTPKYTGGVVGFFDSSSGSIQNVALNKRLINTPGSPGVPSYFGISTTSITYYNKDIYSPEGSAETYSVPLVNSLPINPYTMSQSTPPFNSWDFDGPEYIWKWDDSINRPILRKVKQ